MNREAVEQVDPNPSEAGEVTLTQGNPNPVYGRWYEEPSLIIFTAGGVVAREKIAGFSLIGTLITTISGNVVPEHAEDWKVRYPETSKMLKQCYNDGYKIVIFTNQYGLGVGDFRLQDFKWYIERIVSVLGVPIQLFTSTKRDIFRKPSTGMWDYLSDKKNGNVPIDAEKSFYCGDLAGRPANNILHRRKDHSLIDRLFSINIKCKFYTPEENFRNEPPAYFDPPLFSPSSINRSLPVFLPTFSLKPKEQEIAIMVGSPGSGKSRFVKRYMLDFGYIQIIGYDLYFRDDFASMVMEILRNNPTKSIIFDSTNATVETRRVYIELAKEMGLKIRAFCMTTTQQHAHHNIKFQQLAVPNGNYISIPHNLIDTFFCRYVAPQKYEGFYEIVDVNFIPEFHNADEERLYNKFSLEN